MQNNSSTTFIVLILIILLLGAIAMPIMIYVLFFFIGTLTTYNFYCIGKIANRGFDVVDELPKVKETHEMRKSMKKIRNYLKQGENTQDLEESVRLKYSPGEAEYIINKTMR